MNFINRTAKVIGVIVLIFLFSLCGSKQLEVERLIEDGVEVIVNHQEPYKIEREPSSLIFEKDFSIDLERDDIANIGLTDIRYFDADSEGNIYFCKLRGTGNFIYKFDKSGTFIDSFGSQGQGPGEIQYVYYFFIDSKDNIIVVDETRKVLFFNKDGMLVKEIRFGTKIEEAIPLEKGKYIEIRGTPDLTKETFPIKLILCNKDFVELKELDVFIHPNPLKGNKRPYRIYSFMGKATKDKIYIGNEQRGYEILVYDLDGNLIRKIRKDYKALAYPEEFKKETENHFIENPRSKKSFYITKDMPPFNTFFIDEEDRLYVMTYEKGDKEGEYIHDIFNSDGIFIARKSIKNYGRLNYQLTELNAIAKNNCLYCFQEKESGYKELVVYKLNWE